jgi:hypothetical protein
MISTGMLLRMIGAAILLIAVQFATLTAQAHSGLSHVPDGHSLHAHGAAGGIAHSVSSHRTANQQVQARPAAQAATAVQNADIAPASSDACVTGCCGAGIGCCAHALASAAPNFPPRLGSLRIDFARLISVREVDPRGLRKPPRSLA